MTAVSGDASPTGVEEAIYVDAGATGRNISQFRGAECPQLHQDLPTNPI